MAGAESSKKAILYALLANSGIAVAKGGAAFYTGSGSMLAETIHSLADCVNQLLLFLGLHRSNRPATPEHPMGYGKVVYFWSFIVAILLFSMGGLFSIYEGTHKIMHPEELSHGWLALAVLFVSIILESFSLYGALRVIKKLRKKKSVMEWFKTTRNAELLVVFGEDIAALIGLTVAFIFVSIAMITGNTVYDAIGSVCIGIFLIFISLVISVRIKALLIGRSAEPELQELIHKEIGKEENIEQIFNIITMQFGPHVMLAAKIRLKSGLDIDTACRLINQLEQKIKAEFTEIKWCFMEPDISD